jgi:hypothetical protein
MPFFRSSNSSKSSLSSTSPSTPLLSPSIFDSSNSSSPLFSPNYQVVNLLSAASPTRSNLTTVHTARLLPPRVYRHTSTYFPEFDQKVKEGQRTKRCDGRGTYQGGLAPAVRRRRVPGLQSSSIRREDPESSSADRCFTLSLFDARLWSRQVRSALTPKHHRLRTGRQVTGRIATPRVPQGHTCGV